jgi:hypothetical protein
MGLDARHDAAHLLCLQRGWSPLRLLLLLLLHTTTAANRRRRWLQCQHRTPSISRGGMGRRVAHEGLCRRRDVAAVGTTPTRTAAGDELLRYGSGQAHDRLKFELQVVVRSTTTATGPATVLLPLRLLVVVA